MRALHSKVLGRENRPVLLILHGLFGSGDNWLSLGRRFAQHCEVHLLDLRNHGRSFHSEVMGFDALCEDLRYYKLQHSLSEFFLLGHSLGGKAVMHYALHHPESVSGLLVADIAPGRYAPHHQAVFEALQAVDLGAVESRTQLEAQLAQRLHDPAVRQFLMKSAYRPKGGSAHFAWRFNLPVLARSYKSLIGEVPAAQPFEGPVCFIRAENSGYLTPAHKPLIQRYFPRATLETLPDTGHWLHAEKPDAFYRKTSAFLQKYSS